MAGAGAKGWQIEPLRCACVWFGEVTLALHSPLLREMGFGGNLPSGDVKELWGLSHGPWVWAGISARLISDESFGGQDILKPTWAQSVLEFLLLVFKSLSCGEKRLLSAKTQRALEEENLRTNQEKTCRSSFSDALRNNYSLFPFFLISCPELTGFSSTFLACSRLSAELLAVPPQQKLGEREDFREKFCFCCSSPGCCPWPLLGPGCRVG